jgi:hypothetical protein
LSDTNVVIARLDRAIQYAAASRVNHCGLWILVPRRSLSSGGHSADPLAGMTSEYEAAFSRRNLHPSYSISFAPPRMEGAGVPGARCTRGFVCGSCASKKLHTNIQVER